MTLISITTLPSSRKCIISKSTDTKTDRVSSKYENHEWIQHIAVFWEEGWSKGHILCSISPISWGYESWLSSTNVLSGSLQKHPYPLAQKSNVNWPYVSLTTKGLLFSMIWNPNKPMLNLYSWFFILLDHPSENCLGHITWHSGQGSGDTQMKMCCKMSLSIPVDLWIIEC